VFLKQERKCSLFFSFFKYKCGNLIIDIYQLINIPKQYMKFTALSVLFLLPLFAFCQEPMAQNYKIYNTAKGSIATVEMFQTDCQTVLNEYLADFIREKNLITEGRTWKNYKDYRPMVETAKAAHLPVIAANAPTRYTNMVTRVGLAELQKLDATAKGWLAPLPIDTATGPYYEKFVAIMGGHSAMGNLKIYQSQNLWDATMGWNIAQFLKAHQGYKVFQVNGGFHSEEKMGTVAQLKKYLPKVRIINIQAYADDSFDNPDWSKFTKMGDYVILTNPKLAKTF
jgi:uncharacterized iron-regulated protein